MAHSLHRPGVSGLHLATASATFARIFKDQHPQLDCIFTGERDKLSLLLPPAQRAHDLDVKALPLLSSGGKLLALRLQRGIPLNASDTLDSP